MKLQMRVVEKTNQPMQYTDVQTRISAFECALRNVDTNIKLSLGKVSIVQDGMVKEFLEGGTAWKDVKYQGWSYETGQWFADVVVISSSDSLIERLKLHPYDDGSMLAFVLEPLQFGE